VSPARETLLKGSASVDIAADAQRIWSMISDVTRMGEWSPECRSCEWLDGEPGPAQNARFRGHNGLGPLRWSTVCTVEACEPGSEFTFIARHVSGATTRWSYHLIANGVTTRVTESFEAVHTPAWIRAIERTIGRARVLQRGMAATLERLRDAAERRPDALGP